MFFQQLRFGGVAFYEADFTIKFLLGFQCFVAKKLVGKTWKKSFPPLDRSLYPCLLRNLFFCGMPTHSQLWLHHYQLEFLVIRVVECASRCRLTRKVPGKPNEAIWQIYHGTWEMVAGRWPSKGDASPRTLAARLKLKFPPRVCSEGGDHQGHQGWQNSSFRTKLQSCSPRCAKLPGDLSWLNPPGWPFRRPAWPRGALYKSVGHGKAEAVGNAAAGQL